MIGKFSRLIFFSTKNSKDWFASAQQNNLDIRSRTALPEQVFGRYKRSFGSPNRIIISLILIPFGYLPNIQRKFFKGPKRGQFSSNPLGENPSDIWDIPNMKFNHVEKTDHPCQFPVGLVERLILALTDRDNNVLDPYLGVGSTAIAALKNNRDAYGCDTVKSYIKIALDRIGNSSRGHLEPAQ